MKLFQMARRYGMFLLVFAAIAICLCACGKKVPDYVAGSATIEAGSAFTADNFILEGEHTAAFTEEFSAKFVQDGSAKLTKVGKQTVPLIVDGEKYKIRVTVKDSVAPVASARLVTVGQGGTLQAERCVTNIQDKTAVSCAFQNEPDLTKAGVVQEVVVLTDEGGNTTQIPVTITVLQTGKVLADSFTIEAGDSIPAADALVVLGKTGKYVTDISVINTSLVGKHTLELEVDGASYTTQLIVEDTVAPTATVVPMSIYYGAKFPEASSFVSDIVDKGPVTVTYETDPGAMVVDQTAVRIVLTDQSGNRTAYSAQCNVIQDKEAPKFTAFPQKIDADLGQSIIWRALVTAEDNSGTVELSLDTSGVDSVKPGTYSAFLVAKDPAGNETKQEIKIVLHDNAVTKEMMDQVCEKILSKIITEDMTTKEKLYAVYRYVISHITYVSSSPHDDVRREAYLSLTSRPKGDCFAFYAASTELLSYLGYETQMVRRDLSVTKDYGNHFWVLVNCGTEEEPQWYHHDSCPHIEPYNLPTYMLTDAQMKAYTNYRGSTSPKQHYYTFDASLHPASATEITVDLGIDPKYFE